MTDADLIAALGWDLCDPEGARHPIDGVYCSRHDDQIVDRDVCETVADLLDDVRAGIDLARTGIAGALKSRAIGALEQGEGTARSQHWWHAVDVVLGWGK